MVVVVVLAVRGGLIADGGGSMVRKGVEDPVLGGHKELAVRQGCEKVDLELKGSCIELKAAGWVDGRRAGVHKGEGWIGGQETRPVQLDGDVLHCIDPCVDWWVGVSNRDELFLEGFYGHEVSQRDAAWEHTINRGWVDNRGVDEDWGGVVAWAEAQEVDEVFVGLGLIGPNIRQGYVERGVAVGDGNLGCHGDPDAGDEGGVEGASVV